MDHPDRWTDLFEDKFSPIIVGKNANQAHERDTGDKERNIQDFGNNPDFRLLKPHPLH
ncbi:hypothetical protein NI17_009375 [Thermobifida halotolerans]|uniref:Uncharacterized protein n=1 Tax=Thermobifida halotolerans TaxID=483545 RepID=A0AA97M1X0_9ACTN|nr:hypothetical protein [Thermobifida halotolerans]UOE22248.1 hypothetical protein NI17_009375 [Thermobifida halotolerans]